MKKSRKNGFTEPDPRDDLNGMDVARKILILARETGVQLELSDVSVENLIPSEMDPNLSVDEFLDQIAKFDSYFLDRYESVKKKKSFKIYRNLGRRKSNCRIKYCGRKQSIFSPKWTRKFSCVYNPKISRYTHGY